MGNFPCINRCLSRNDSRVLDVEISDQNSIPSAKFNSTNTNNTLDYPEGNVSRDGENDPIVSLVEKSSDKITSKMITTSVPGSTQNHDAWVPTSRSEAGLLPKQPDDSHVFNKCKGDGEDLLCQNLTKSFPENDFSEKILPGLELKRSKITLKRPLGKGQFGEVFEGQLNDSTVAVKCLMNPDKRQDFINEAICLYKLKHPRILQIMGVCTLPRENPILIVTEFMYRGSLQNILRNHAQSPWPMNFTIQLICQISDGMEYLETQNCVHGDLRTANILVHEDYSVKLADFGSAHFLSTKSEKIPGIRFPVRWTAPEAATKSLYSSKSDVWSFGVVMYETLTYGKIPYEDIELDQIIDRIEHGYRLPNPLKDDNFESEKFYEIMLKCWEANPTERPSFKDLHWEFGHWDTSQL